MKKNTLESIHEIRVGAFLALIARFHVLDYQLSHRNIHLRYPHRCYIMRMKSWPLVVGEKT